MRKILVGVLVIVGGCHPVETAGDGEAPDGSLDGSSSSLPAPDPCGPLQPCTDAVGEAVQMHGCTQQHPGAVRALGCAFNVPTPGGCADLASVAPLMCSDGTAVRVVCCY